MIAILLKREIPMSRKGAKKRKLREKIDRQCLEKEKNFKKRKAPAFYTPIWNYLGQAN